MNGIPTLALLGLQIIWINVLLSGDNAVVIALACRDLEKRQRRWAILAGSLVAVVLRVVFTIFIVELLALPFVKIVSALLLVWIAFGLLRSHTKAKTVAAASSIWTAVRTIALADVIMSLDNVVAVAAAAKNDLPLIAFGIAVSVPLIIFGSTLVLRMLNRFPILVVAGAALLGWIGGEIAVTDPALERWFGPLPDNVELFAAAGGAALILAAAATMRVLRQRRDRAAPSPSA